MIARVALDGLPLQVRSAGIAVYTEALVRAMARQRPNTEFVLFGMAEAGVRLLGGQPDRAPAWSEWPANVRWVRSPLYPAIMGYPIPSLPRLIRVESAVPAADVFHGTNYALPRSRTVALVTTVHDLALLRFPELGTSALRRFLNAACRSFGTARVIIADSNATRSDLIELLGVAEEKIRVIYIGCDDRFRAIPTAEARAQVHARHGISDPYILFVGTIEPRKNLPVLLRAYARLRTAGKLGHRLVLAGDRGWNDASVFDLIAKLQLDATVQWLGKVSAEDLPALYAGADAFVYPSRYEGFGLPVLEAMACGTPVVTSNVSSLPEVAGDAAILVDPLDETAVAGAIERVLTDAALAQEMRGRGLERARLFSRDRCARETLAVYDEAVRS